MYIEGMVAKKLAECIGRNSDVTDPTKNIDGIAGYIANGFSDNNWINISRYVSLANGGAQTYAFGSELALANVVPDLTTLQHPTANFIVDEDSSFVKNGYLPTYKKVPMIEMHDALLPNTINGAPHTILPDDIIYMMPAGMYKPIKVVFEGGNVSVTKDPSQMADHTYTFQINMMVGVDIVVGAKFGAITL